MNIQNDLSELVKEQIISEEIAKKITNYYKGKENPSKNTLFVIFGILGALLVGLGIILLIAHNWDFIPKLFKTFLAFVPLLIGQVACAYSILKRQNHLIWRESTSTFLLFSIGSSIALVSQIYHISGDFGTFILTWMLLTLPMIYLMNSGITSIFFIVGITIYACDLAYWNYPYEIPYLYWILLFLVFPFYYLLKKKANQSNYLIFLNWIIPLSILIVLGSFSDRNNELMYVAYVSLFNLFYLLGKLEWINPQIKGFNGFQIVGILGLIFILFLLSFNWFWEEIIRHQQYENHFTKSIEFYVSFIITITSLFFLFLQYKTKGLNSFSQMDIIFILFILVYIIGNYSSFSVLFINLIIFSIGILKIREGSKLNHLGILNVGLLIITLLIICRFFDTYFSFVTRGILFVAVGIGFFLANYLILKKRKLNE